MTEDFGMEAAVSLDTMIERHIGALSATSEAVHEWDERRAAGDVTNVVYAKALLEVTKEEEAARLRIVNHWPCNDQQGWQKLTYLAAYLFATRGSLKPEEMDAVLSTTEPVEWACALAWQCAGSSVKGRRIKPPLLAASFLIDCGDPLAGC